MSKEVKLVLRNKRNIRGEVYPAGTVLFTGECSNNFTPEDIEKAFQSRDAKVDLQSLESGIKKAGNKKSDNSAQNQNQK